MSGNIRGRRNWTRSLTVVMLVAIAGAVIGGLGQSKEVKTDRKYFKSTAGAVLFDHGEHSKAADSCVQCHHNLYSAAQATPCQDCHDEGMEADDFDHSSLKEIHSLDCSKCHEQTIDDDQAISCRECHTTPQEKQLTTPVCIECHDDGYSPEMMEHDEYMDIDEHACLSCHTPGPVSDAYHTNCSQCHLENAPGRFAEPDGDVLCGACHLR